MFKVAKRTNVEGTVDYFLKEPALSTDEKAGTWMGEGAKALGLCDSEGRSIPVTEEDLRAALQGKAPPSSPSAGRPLNARYRQNRRVAYEVVLSPDKSVSVAALCLPPEQRAKVRQAFLAAVDDTFAVMELHARHKHDPARGRPTTQTLLAARFVHETSRRARDPHLHAHLLLLNATLDRRPFAPRSWYALESLPFYRLAKQFNHVFQCELARHLRLQGFVAQLRKVGTLFTAVLPAVARKVCARLSSSHLAIKILARAFPRRTEAEKRLTEKQWENLLNDRHRPKKRGSRAKVAAQAQTFERALSRVEVQEIIARLPAGVPTPANPKPLPSYVQTEAGQVRVFAPVFASPPPEPLPVVDKLKELVRQGLRLLKLEDTFTRILPRRPSNRLRAAIEATSLHDPTGQTPLVPFVAAALRLTNREPGGNQLDPEIQFSPANPGASGDAGRGSRGDGHRGRQERRRP